MKHVCRICLKETTDLNFLGLEMDELSSQIKMHLSICIPEMDADLVKDPVFCKSCVNALDSAYNFKILCLHTEELIKNFKRLHRQPINIEDLLHDSQQSRRNGICENNGKEENTREKCFTVITPNMNSFLTDLVDGQNWDDPLRIAPIQPQVFKQKCEYEDITIKEEDIAVPKVKLPLPCEGFEDNLFEAAEADDHKIEVKTMDNNDDKSKCFSCGWCKFHTVQKHSLIMHLRIHTAEKPFACNVCTFRFAQKSGLQNHLRTHSGEKPFACNVCAFRSAHKSSLQDHLRIHTGEKPFACNACSFCSARKSSLQDHLRIHTKAKPFVCHMCTYRTAQKTHLRRHLQNHTGEKPFACNVCPYRAALNSYLQKHLLIHTGEKPFACNVCDFCSARKSSLEEHIRIHTGEKPFGCNLCNSTFSHRIYFRQHMKTHQNQSETKKSKKGSVKYRSTDKV